MTPGYFSFINTAQICLWIKIRWATRSWSARSTECWWREPYLLSIILNNSWLSEWQKQILLRDHHSPAPLQCSRCRVSYVSTSIRLDTSAAPLHSISRLPTHIAHGAYIPARTLISRLRKTGSWRVENRLSLSFTRNFPFPRKRFSCLWRNQHQLEWWTTDPWLVLGLKTTDWRLPIVWSTDDARYYPSISMDQAMNHEFLESPSPFTLQHNTRWLWITFAGDTGIGWLGYFTLLCWCLVALSARFLIKIQVSSIRGWAYQSKSCTSLSPKQWINNFIIIF